MRLGTTTSSGFYVFDLVYQDRSLSQLPLEVRKEALAGLITRDAWNLQYVEHIAGEGKAFFEVACGAGLEGIVSKRRLGLPAGTEPELVEVEVEKLSAVCGLGVVGEEGNIKAGQNRLLTGPSTRLASWLLRCGRGTDCRGCPSTVAAVGGSIRNNLWMAILTWDGSPVYFAWGLHPQKGSGRFR